MATVKGAVCKIDLLTLNLVSQSKFKIYLSGCQTPAGVLLWKAHVYLLNFTFAMFLLIGNYKRPIYTSICSFWRLRPPEVTFK